jgi:hypothetical protein
MLRKLIQRVASVALTTVFECLTVKQKVLEKASKPSLVGACLWSFLSETGRETEVKRNAALLALLKRQALANNRERERMGEREDGKCDVFSNTSVDHGETNFANTPSEFAKNHLRPLFTVQK